MRDTPEPKQLLGQALMLAGRDFQARLDQDLQRRDVMGISARHRAIFLHLGRHGPSRAVDLARSAGVRPQSMMKIIHELESLNLLERRTDPADSRAKLIDFSHDGRLLIDELTRSTETVWQQYVGIVGEENLERMVHQLSILATEGEQKS